MQDVEQDVMYIGFRPGQGESDGQAVPGAQQMQSQPQKKREYDAQ